MLHGHWSEAPIPMLAGWASTQPVRGAGWHDLFTSGVTWDGDYFHTPEWGEVLIPPIVVWADPDHRPKPAQWALTLDAFTRLVTVRGVPSVPVWALRTGNSGPPRCFTVAGTDASGAPTLRYDGLDAWAGLLPPLVTLHASPGGLDAHAWQTDEEFNCWARAAGLGELTLWADPVWYEVPW